MSKYLQALHATLSAWGSRAPKDPDHLLRHPAREDNKNPKNKSAPKRRLFRSTRRQSLQTVLGCLFKYDNREYGCIGTPQPNKLPLGIGGKKIKEETTLHKRTIERRRQELRKTGWIKIKEKAKRDPKGRFTFIPAVEALTDKAYETIGFVRNPSVYFQKQQEKNHKRAQKLKPLVKGYADEAFKCLQKKFGDALNKNAAVMQKVLMDLNFGKQMTMQALCTFVESMLTTGPPPDPIPA